MTTPSQSCLRLRRGPTHSVLVTLDADGYEPNWSNVLDLIATTIFAGRDVCFAGYDPVDWDVDFTELSGRRSTIHHGTTKYMLAFAERVTAAQILAAVRSTDFRLGLLFIVALPEMPGERAAAFVAALEHRGQRIAEALAGAWTEALLAPALEQAYASMAKASPEEYIYCESDGEVLVWYHPDAAALRRCVTVLNTLAAQNDWRLELNFSVEA
ncbi:MAG: hypothetical protein CVU38_02460 [Chloroflexi bacterium HGW-Chloroflexi-1]|nr:MAG: hypothetical protein CVU38_02460 [Chloroflexi bacterium HGW-Chloroflexi-1]